MRASYPDLSASAYSELRNRFRASPPQQVTATYLENVLGTSLKTAQNTLPQIKALGLVGADGRLTPLAHNWRFYEHYMQAVSQIRQQLYPQELRALYP
jgi:hypothetical protein